jgi:protein-S-isoprenylcysteine O-methyltransferase Ste14
MSLSSIIVYSWGMLTLVWLAGAMRTKPSLRATSLGMRTLCLAAILLGFLLVLWNGFPSVFAARALPPSHALQRAGAALTVLGCAFAIWARLALGTNWSGRPTVKAGHELVIRGPYALARHPIYTGLLVAAIGTALADLQWRRLLGVAIIAAAVLVKIRQEESLMMETFPDSYPSYRRRVKALIPGLF